MNKIPGTKIIGIRLNDAYVIELDEELKKFNKHYELHLNRNQFITRIIQRYINRKSPDPIGDID